MTRFGVGIEFGIGTRLFAFVGLLDAIALGLDIGLPQATRNVDLQSLGQLQHALAQLPPFASGQAQRQRPFGLRYLVQKQQIGRHRAGGRVVLHELAHERSAAGADFAHHQQVVARQGHAQAKAGSGFGPLLPDPGQGPVQQFAGAGKAQTGRIHPAQKIVRFNALASHGPF